MSSSNNKKSVGESEAVDKHVEHPKLEKLKRLRESFNWKFENHRYRFLNEFGPIIKDWKEQLPNLRDIFTKQEMDWILTKSIKKSLWSERIVDFVIRSGYKDEPDFDEDGKPLLRRTTAVHQIAEWHQWASKSEVLKNLFKIYDKFHVNYTDELGYTHFHVACISGLHEVAEKFLELGQDPNCLVPGTGNSLLYCVAEPIIRLLLKHGADPNQTNEDGSTPLHVICQLRNCITHSVILMLLESVDEVQQTVLINAQDNRGDTPLHLSLKDGNNERTVQELLRRGANPNSTNAKGQAPVHLICQNNWNIYILKRFFDICDEKRLPVLLDIGDNEGNTPLHLALKNGKDIWTVEELLRRGADPCLANAEGQTPLHVICQRYENLDWLERFFKFIDEFEKTVQIDAQDNEGNTPLHLAILCGNPLMVKSLLRRSADPCLSNAKGQTPLHFVCEKNQGWNLLKLFFNFMGRGANSNLPNAEGRTPLHLIARIDVHGNIIRIFLITNREGQRMVGIDARDDSGRTALEWAVASCLPMAVKSLLDCGANVSGFVFPTPSDSDRYWGKNRQGNNNLGRDCSVFKLTAATGLLAIVELLETRGYIMNRDDALKLMGFFDKYGLYESTDFSTNKDLDDLVDSLFEEMAKKSTYMDYFKFASSYKLPELPRKSMEACYSRLCEKISTKFFRDWALDPFKQLIYHRMPTECCEIVIKKLKNKDLFNICLTAPGRSSRQ